jgi:hypothetical protein
VDVKKLGVEESAGKARAGLEGKAELIGRLSVQ